MILCCKTLTCAIRAEAWVIEQTKAFYTNSETLRCNEMSELIIPVSVLLITFEHHLHLT